MRCHGRHRRIITALRQNAWIALLAAFFVASAQADWLDWRPALRTTYRPENVWRMGDRMDAAWRRVAVLPVTAAPGVKLDADSLRMLQDALRLELTRGHQFEITDVPVSRLESWIGQPGVRAQQELSARLFNRLKEELAADLVLFVEITEFKAYAPLRVGWHLKLVGISDIMTIWEADELFDSSAPAVSRGAVRHDRASSGKPKPLRDGWNGRNSPRQFAEYSVRALVATLPRRTASVLR